MTSPAKSLLTVMLCSFVTFAAKTEMTYEEYEVALANAMQREKAAKELIAEEQAKIQDLRKQISDIESDIAAIIQEKYDILGITEQDVLNAESEIASIRQDLEMLLALSPEELLRRVDDIKKDEARINALKAKPVSYLWRVRDQIVELDELLERVKSYLPEKALDYTVQLIPDRRDCLWRIADNDQVYGDATQWPNLYRANKAQIDAGYNRYIKHSDDPKYSRPEDLIFPGQVLDIPR